MKKHVLRATAIAFVAMSAGNRAVQDRPPGVAQASRVQLKVQLGHSGEISQLAVSPDGRFLLTGSADRTARLWDVATGREVRRFEGHSNKVTSVAFGPDGRRVLTSSLDNTARIWDLGTGREILRLEKPSRAETVAFSPDGRSVLTGEDGAVRLWDASTGREIRSITTDMYTGKIAAFSPDGRRVLACCVGGGARLWEVSTGQEIRRFSGLSYRTKSVAFSPDGRWLLSASLAERADTRLWDAGTGREVRRFAPISHLGVHFVAFLPSGRFVLSDGQAVQVWDAPGGREFRRFDLGSYTTALTVFPLGQSIVSAHFDKTARQWDIATARETTRFRGVTGISSLAVSPDGRSIVTGSLRSTRVWDLTIGQEIRRFRDTSSAVDDTAVSPDGLTVVTATYEPHALLRELTTGREIHRFALPSGARAAAFSPDGRSVVTGTSDGTVHLWNVETGRESRRFVGHTRPVKSAAFSPDGRLLLMGSLYDTAKLWDVPTGQLIRSVGSAGWGTGAIAFSPDGKSIVTGSSDGSARLYETATGREIHRLVHPDQVLAVGVSADGQRIVTGSRDHLVRLWDAARGVQTHVLAGHTDSISAATFTPDGRVVITGSTDGTVKIWNTTTGRPLATLVSFNDGGWAVVDAEGRYDAFDPDNSPGLYFLRDLEVIDLKQLKERFYAPRLLARVLGFNAEPLSAVAQLQQLQPTPSVNVTSPAAGQSVATLQLDNRGGGLGRVVVKVNGRELARDARSPSINPDAASATLTVDLSGAALAADGRNTIEVIAYPKDDLVAGRGLTVAWSRAPSAPAAPPALHAIVAGVSNYENPSLNLTFPAKDAQDMARALQLGAVGLFPGGVNIATLATGTAQEPTKDNLRRAFEAAATRAGPNDVLLVYLAGHGVSGRTERDTYYFLTREARSTDPDADPALRKASTLSSAELLEWLRLKGMPLKQVVVLDTCAAGAAATELLKLADRRELTADQTRAIELLKDATGSHILMGSAADRVSYEASRYGQGLLTYALLAGMRGEALDDGGRLDVRRWFDTAQSRVPELARGIGGIQQPLVSSPKGQTFPIALLTPATRGDIPLPLLKPQLLRATCLDENDDDRLGLCSAVRAELRTISSPVSRGAARAEPPLVYVDQVAGEVADAWLPQVRYWIEPAGMRIRLRLRKDGAAANTPPLEFTVTVASRDPAELARRVVEEFVKLLQVARRP